MTKPELIKCIDFFNQLTVNVFDITTEEDLVEGNKVVEAEYIFDGLSFKTKPLYYKEITGLPTVKGTEYLHNYFGEKVYWLDIDEHPWPRGSGESDLDNLVAGGIINEGDIEFKGFLHRLANNDQTGYIQRITSEGRSGQYYHNLENNNHWHDLVLLIKAVIKSKGAYVNKELFKHLVFNWDTGKRVTLGLDSKGGPFKIIRDLYQNVKQIQTNMDQIELIKLLQYKKQIILQGPPGTGKTKLAKEIASELIGFPVSETNTTGEYSDQFKLIQFHPSYSYEDFVRGIIAKPNEEGTGILYEAENKILGVLAKQAYQNYQDSKDLPAEIPEPKFNRQLELFIDKVRNDIDKDGESDLGSETTAKIIGIIDGAFIYSFEKRMEIKYRLLFSDLISISNYPKKISRTTDILDMEKGYRYIRLGILTFCSFTDGKKR